MQKQFAWALHLVKYFVSAVMHQKVPDMALFRKAGTPFQDAHIREAVTLLLPKGTCYPFSMQLCCAVCYFMHDHSTGEQMQCYGFG